jgi:hypothetical protein
MVKNPIMARSIQNVRLRPDWNWQLLHAVGETVAVQKAAARQSLSAVMEELQDFPLTALPQNCVRNFPTQSKGSDRSAGLTLDPAPFFSHINENQLKTR